MKLYVGGTARIDWTVKIDATGTLDDPDTTLVKVKDPNGSPTTYTYGVSSNIAKVSTGTYYANISTPTAGIWRYRIEVSGGVADVEEGSFVVTPSAGF